MANVKLVSIKSLKKSKHNPASRTKNVKGLKESIGRVGLLDPIKISTNNEIIDGHRRTKVYEELGIAEIEAIVLSGDAAKIYAELNSQSKKLTGNEVLNVYLVNPDAVSPLIKARMDSAIETVGEALFKRLADEGLSLRAVHIATTICKINGRETPQNIVKALKWLLHFGMFGVAQKAITANTPPSKIWAAIERHKPLRASFDVSK